MKTTSEEGFSSSWSREQEKAFENALAIHFENCEGRWEKIADFVNGKSPDEIKHHYDLLVEDINGIESGRVPLPPYVSSLDELNEDFNESEAGKRNVNFGSSHGDSSGKGSRSEQERRKGIAWTEDEHRLFLLGLEKYGKGDWRSISRNFVVSRTPTQVASHAQKYFIRLNSMNKDRRRSSIHDITNVNSGEASVSQGPITGQSNVQSGSVGKSSKPYSQPPNLTGLGHYGSPTIGQPIPGSLVSAIGTPINLPTPAHMSYGIHGTIPGLVPGAPMINPLSYPMQHATSHR